jgi:hypothetical protein
VGANPELLTGVSLTPDMEECKKGDVEIRSEIRG